MLSLRNWKLVIIAVLLLLAVLACNFPKLDSTDPQDPGLAYTLAAQTLEADMTQIAQEGYPTQAVPTQQPPENATDTPSLPTDTPAVPTNTPKPSPTATKVPCDSVAFVDDITIEDGTEISAGELYQKIWRLKNDGSCTWTSEYDLVFDSGDQMDAPDDQPLTTGEVLPGQEIDIEVDLVAPDDPGKYRGNFKIRNPEGTVFGLGEESKPFWVEIRVPDESGVRFDFLARAKDAEWGSGVEPVDFAGPGHDALSYGGQNSDSDGFVRIRDQVLLENGKTSGKVLQTHPKWVDDGYIIGKYPAFQVGPGDYLSGHLGFIAKSDGTCGSGDVIFEIYYIKDDDLGTRERLGQWSKDCDGSLLPIEISLADLKGESVNFYLLVLANGSSGQDWAIWSSLGVMR